MFYGRNRMEIKHTSSPFLSGTPVSYNRSFGGFECRSFFWGLFVFSVGSMKSCHHVNPSLYKCKQGIVILHERSPRDCIKTDIICLIACSLSMINYSFSILTRISWLRPKRMPLLSIPCINLIYFHEKTVN